MRKSNNNITIGTARNSRCFLRIRRWDSASQVKGIWKLRPRYRPNKEHRGRCLERNQRKIRKGVEKSNQYLVGKRKQVQTLHPKTTNDDL